MIITASASIIIFFSQGFMCQGNEWSLYMLFASHFVLNRLVHCKRKLNVKVSCIDIED